MLITYFKKPFSYCYLSFLNGGYFIHTAQKNKYHKNIIVAILSNVCIIGKNCIELVLCYKRTLLWKYIPKRKHTRKKQQQKEKITPSGVVQHTYTFAPIPILEEIT